MNKEMKYINSKIKNTIIDVEGYENTLPSMLEKQKKLEAERENANLRLDEAVKDIVAQIEALDKKRDKVSEPIKMEIESIRDKQTDLNYTINQGETKSKMLGKLKKIKQIIEKVDAGYYIIKAGEWGGSETLGGFNKNNYRPDGWYIVDIFVKGTSIYCQSSIAKSPRKLFNMATAFRWTVTLSNALIPMLSTQGGRVKECPKCKVVHGLIQSKTCPVCRKKEGTRNIIEYTCRECGHVEDCSADDKHKFSDEPETIEVKSDLEE